MANLKLRLTEAICARSRPTDIEYAIRDLGQDNLTLRVRPSGMRSWIVRCRIDDKQQKVTLGSYPEMSLKEARKAAGSFNGKLTAPPLPRKMPLFSSFQKEHEERHGMRYKPSGLVSYRSYVVRQLLPAFARKRIDAIRRVDIIRWLETYSLTSPGAANRALGILTQILNCAKAWGYFPEGWINPASSLRYNRRNRMGTFLSMEKMERLGGVLSGQAGQGCLASALLHVLALTGCRVGEIIRLGWGDVLHDRLRLKDSKTGPRDVPLGASAHRYIKARRKASNDAQGLVFPLPQPSPYEAVRKVWNAAKQQADLPANLRIHDLRHSFASHAIMAGESLFTVSRLLGHSRVQTTARYAHLADHAILDCAEKIGRLILAQAAPPAPRSLRRDSGQRDAPASAPAPFREDVHAIQLHGGGQHGDRRGS